VALAKAADSDKARLAAEAKAAEALKAQATAARQTVAANVTTTVTTGQFSPGRNMEARGTPGYSALYGSIASVGDCEQICARSDTCKAFAYGKQNRTCYLYTSSVVLVANENFDSGIRK
jgi:hypothetical protein